MQTIILSGSIHETYAWADAQGRHRRTVRHVPHAGSIQGRAYDGIVELPSFASRRDRHAVMVQLKKLRRQMPKLPYEVDEDWVAPERPKKVDRKHIDPQVFLFSNTPEPTPPSEEIQRPLGDLWFEAVEAEADEDFSLDDEPSEEPAETPEIDQVTEELGQVADELTQLGQAMEAETAATAETSDEAARDAKYDAIAAIGELGSDEPDAPKPKRKGRRTNEQKAFDEAFQAYGEAPTEENSAVLTKTRDALRKRHPDDERLRGDLPDLDF